jgi:hypothetical protein
VPGGRPVRAVADPPAKIVQLGCFLFAVSSLSVSADKTFENDMWGYRVPKLDVVLEAKTFNHTYVVSADFGNSRDIPWEINGNTVVYLLAQLAYTSKFVIVVAAIAVFLGAINRVLFDLNIFRLQQHYLIIRKDLLTCLDCLVLILGLILLAEADRLSAPLRDFFEDAGLSNENTIPYVAPYVELYFAFTIGLASHVVTAFLHLYNAQRKDLPVVALVVPDVKFAKAQLAAETEELELQGDEEYQQDQEGYNDDDGGDPFANDERQLPRRADGSRRHHRRSHRSNELRSSRYQDPESLMAGAVHSRPDSKAFGVSESASGPATGGMGRA